MIPPILRSFDLDLDSGFLNLTFNEVISASSFIASFVSFTNSSNTVMDITLTESAVLNGNGLNIDVTLFMDDLNTLKSHPVVGKSRQSTYLFFEEGAFADVSGNNITALTEAVRVNRLIRDARPPALSEFNVDIAGRTIELIFDEIVNAEEFSATSLTLINSTQSPPASSFFRLTTSSTVTSANGTTVTIAIGNEDFNFLSDILDLATDDDNTFLLLDGSALTDLAGNPIIAIRVPDPFPVTSFSPDSEPPFLREYSLDLSLIHI